MSFSRGDYGASRSSEGVSLKRLKNVVVGESGQLDIAKLR